jgi:hypothetical protein
VNEDRVIHLNPYHVEVVRTTEGDWDLRVWGRTRADKQYRIEFRPMGWMVPYLAGQLWRIVTDLQARAEQFASALRGGKAE